MDSSFLRAAEMESPISQPTLLGAPAPPEKGGHVQLEENCIRVAGRCRRKLLDLTSSLLSSEGMSIVSMPDLVSCKQSQLFR